MTHLSNEQLEDVLKGAQGYHAHLAQCPSCRGRLEEARALQQRLQSAFASVTAPAGLAERLRATAGKPSPTLRHPLILRFNRYVIPLAAAAAVLILSVPLALFLAEPSPAQAAQAELVSIHRQNLADGHHFYSEDDPEQLARYFKDKLGFVPAMPKLNQGMEIRGCCVAHFRQKIVGSYVVDTPHGVVSIIVVTDEPKSIGLRWNSHRDIWEGNLGMCNMAAERMGNYTYTAVGEMPQDALTQLLGLLVK